MRSTNPVVPVLPMTGSKHASIAAADWLVEVKPIIGDLSTRAHRWWELTLEATLDVYHSWLKASPLQRLRIQPPSPVTCRELGNEQVIQRLEQRVTTILLPALPAELRHDLITARQLWPSAIFYKILRSYQPGGWAERSALLTDLTNTKAIKDPSGAASALRLWQRQKVRAVELGAAIPDALLQVRALENIVSQAVVKHPQALFRISSFRMEVGLDEQPSEATIAQFLELLIAEMDAIALSGSAGVSESSAIPSAKVLQTQTDKVPLLGIHPPNLADFGAGTRGVDMANIANFNMASLKMPPSVVFGAPLRSKERVTVPIVMLHNQHLRSCLGGVGSLTVVVERKVEVSTKNLRVLPMEKVLEMEMLQRWRQ